MKSIYTNEKEDCKVNTFRVFTGEMEILLEIWSLLMYLTFDFKE